MLSLDDVAGLQQFLKEEAARLAADPEFAVHGGEDARRFMADEDAPKKSLTDAITKAAAQVGVGANIFLGRWDDSRYVAQVNGEYRSKEPADAQPAPAEVFKAATDNMDKAADMEALRAAWANLTDSQAWKGAPEKWRQKASACFDRNLGRLTPNVEVKDVPDNGHLYG